MKELIYIILFFTIFSCSKFSNKNDEKELENSEILNNNISVTDTLLKDQISSNQDLENDQISDNIIKKKVDINAFIKELKNQPIEPLPFGMESYLILENSHKSNYFTNLKSILKIKQDTSIIINSNKLSFNKKDSINVLLDFTKPYLKSYYYLLTKKCELSQYFFFKRLMPINNIEVFINFCKILSYEDKIFDTNIIMKINFLDTKSKKIINSSFIRVSGIAVNAENDPGFYEGFKIDKNYNITIKSYTSTESKGIQLTRKLFVDAKGNFIEELISGTKTKSIVNDKGDIVGNSQPEKFSIKIDYRKK